MNLRGLSFRNRILLVIVLVGAVPTTIAVVGWALTLRVGLPARATTTAIESLGESGRDLVGTLDSTRLTEAGRRALAAHTDELSRALTLSQRAETYTRYYKTGLTVTVLALGALLVYASVRLGGHLSRQLSRPMEELVGWTQHILRHEPLPEDQPQRGAPEFAELRTALREMARGLDQGRSQELEAERLRAFREIARRVAHEMKNPLTPIRFAVAQLDRSASPDQREAIDVLLTESRRLEGLARDFTDLGRMPEGPTAEVDIGELLREMVRTSLPAGMAATVQVGVGTPRVLGHFEPLRRAFGNLLRNAAEATDGRGHVHIEVGPGPGSGVRLTIGDDGPGVAPDARDRLFEPYMTTKEEGTGLGLSLVRRTVEAHGGRVTLLPSEGGAVFEIILPRSG